MVCVLQTKAKGQSSLSAESLHVWWRSESAFMPLELMDSFSVQNGPVNAGRCIQTLEWHVSIQSVFFNPQVASTEPQKSSGAELSCLHSRLFTFRKRWSLDFVFVGTKLLSQLFVCVFVFLFFIWVVIECCWMTSSLSWWPTWQGSKSSVNMPEKGDKSSLKWPKSDYCNLIMKSFAPYKTWQLWDCVPLLGCPLLLHVCYLSAQFSDWLTEEFTNYRRRGCNPPISSRYRPMTPG